MIRKIKSSIGLKTFLSIAALLMIYCALIYGRILCFMPTTYKVELESRFNAEVQELAQKLEAGGVESNAQQLVDFSAKNNASIMVVDESGTELFPVKSNLRVWRKVKQFPLRWGSNTGHRKIFFVRRFCLRRLPFWLLWSLDTYLDKFLPSSVQNGKIRYRHYHMDLPLRLKECRISALDK